MRNEEKSVKLFLKIDLFDSISIKTINREVNSFESKSNLTIKNHLIKNVGP
jgi:hypothetical protein